jgi:SAM-dependent methyltransferase
MPTLPLEPSRPADREPHQIREAAESFGEDAERYDRTRPHYPGALVDRIVAGSPGLEVLDVGIGTGIAARQFQAAGCAVLGVEVDARMAELARRRGFEVEVAAFETWDAGGREFDAVVAGQTWHWIDPVAGPAAAARVLRPGGRLAAFWNVGQPQPEAAAAFAPVYERVLPDVPALHGATTALDLYAPGFIKAADGVRQAGAFGEPEQWRVDWTRTYSRDEWLEQIPTHGILTRLPQAKLAEVLDGIGAAIDALGGSFTMEYAAVAVTAART